MGASPRGGGGSGGDSDSYKEGGSGGTRGGSPFATSARLLARQVWEDPNSRKIALFLGINFAFMFVEIAVGWLTNSLGLISDAGHMFFDNASLFIGLYASVMARWKPDGVHTYGYARYEILAGFVNAIFLVFVAVSVVFEALERLWEPPAIHGEHLLPVAVMGLGVNIIGLVFFAEAGGHGHSHGGGHGHSHGGGGATNENMQGVYLHVLADALGSVGVIISSLLIKWYSLYAADPLMSIAISALILVSSWPLLAATAGPLLSAAPDDKSDGLASAVVSVGALPGVVGVSSPHAWKFHADQLVASLHVDPAPGADSQEILRGARALLLAAGAHVVTVQVGGGGSGWVGESDEVVAECHNRVAVAACRGEGGAHGHAGHEGHDHAAHGGHGHAHAGRGHDAHAHDDHHGHSHA